MYTAERSQARSGCLPLASILGHVLLAALTSLLTYAASQPLQALFVAFAVNVTGDFDNPSDASAMVTVGASQPAQQMLWAASTASCSLLPQCTAALNRHCGSFGLLGSA